MLVWNCGSGKQESENYNNIQFIKLEEPSFLALDFTSDVPASSPQRIVSLVPCCTEILFALGLGERVIGVDRWSDYPLEVKNLPELGDYNKIQTETILDLRPDLVIIHESHQDAGELLRRAGLRIFEFRYWEAENVYAGIEAVAEATNVMSRGQRLVKAIQTKIREIEEQVKEKSPRKVLLVFERYPSLSVATKTSYLHNLVQSAGGINVSADADIDKAFTYVSLEQIIDWKPDVIIDLAFGNNSEEGIRNAKSFWADVIDEQKVYLIESPVLTLPGPRMWFCAETIAKLIHP
jgi:iron complex transport system substrate-binding protein